LVFKHKANLISQESVTQNITSRSICFTYLFRSNTWQYSPKHFITIETFLFINA